MTRMAAAGAIGLALLCGGPAGAQVTPVQPQPPAPNMPAPQATPPEKVQGETGQNLSEKLNQSEGVIRPPAGIDSNMTVRPPVPNPNSMPIITPPGEPGGNQSVQPK